MSAFLVARATYLALLVLLSGALCCLAALNLTLSGHAEPLRPVDGYLVFSSAANILFVFIIILIDILRHGAITSRVWFECLWLAVSWLMNLCGAAAVTALSPHRVCNTGSLPSCPTGRVLMPITWLVTGLALFQLMLMVGSSLYYSERFPNVWSCDVRDFAWFNGGGSGKSTQLSSGPPSPAFVPGELTLHPNNPVPDLERMAENWQPTSATQVPAQTKAVASSAKPVTLTEPQPLTLTYAPEIPPVRAPVHYSASAVVSVGVLPGRRLSKKVHQAEPSLYPSSVQRALDESPPKRASTTSAIPSASPPRQAPIRSLTTKGMPVTFTLDPLPVQGWPRTNPQEPYRKTKSVKGQVATPSVAAMSTPKTPASRRSGSIKKRPPPLDLSAASPARIR